MRRSTSLLVILLVATLVVPAGAREPGPNRPSPPHLSLRYKGEVIQRARPFTFCWSYAEPDGSGYGICADGFPRYPRAARVDAPARLTLRIHYPAKPSEWDLTAYRAIVRRDYADEPRGPGEEIAYKLRPHRSGGIIRAWDLVFRLDQPLRHYYLDTGGQLRQGDAFYTLHVRT